MPCRPNSLAFLQFLLLLLLAGNTQATPVSNDETGLQSEIDVVANSIGPPQSPAPPLPLPASVPMAEASRPVSTNGIKLSWTAPVQHTGDSAPASESWVGERMPSQANTLGTAFGEPDPLARTLRSLVNVNRRTNVAVTSPRLADDNTQIDIDLGDEERAAIREVKELVSEAIRTVLDPRADEEGRVTFSLAGIDGFHVATDGNTWSLGFGDTVLTSLQASTHEGETTEHQRAQKAMFVADGSARDKNALRGRQASAVPDEIVQAIEAAKEIIELPLTWFLLALLVIFRAAAKLVAARATLHKRWRPRHRHTSRQVSGKRSNSRSDGLRLGSGPAKL